MGPGGLAAQREAEAAAGPQAVKRAAARQTVAEPAAAQHRVDLLAPAQMAGSGAAQRLVDELAA